MIKNEINDLYDTGKKIVQNSDYFKLSLDSLLLANFIKIDLNDKTVVDFCTGNAPIPIILSKKPKIQIFGIELQTEIYELGVESIKINTITNVKLINDDILNWKKYFKPASIDIISVNPPYFKFDKKSIINKNEIKSIARHEIAINIEEIIRNANLLLKSKGKFYLVHRTNRLMEIINLLSKYHFGIKKIRFIYNNNKTNCSMMLIEAKKDCKDDIIIEPPIFSSEME